MFPADNLTWRPIQQKLEARIETLLLDVAQQGTAALPRLTGIIQPAAALRPVACFRPTLPPPAHPVCVA